MYQAIIIDDEQWVIKSLIATIENQEYFEIVGEFYDGFFLHPRAQASFGLY